MLHVPSVGRKRGQRGNNIIEFSLLIPWYIFLFVGIFDYGFYSYSLIAAQSAARQGAAYCSLNPTTASDSHTACGYALDQLRYLPNVGSALTTCGTTSVSSAAPVAATATYLSAGADGNPASSVSIMYLTPQLIPIPGILDGRMTIVQTVQMRIRT